MTGEQKVTAAHRARRAVVYLRQSSEGQVRHNRESQRLQYALEHQARALGFPQVEIIDTDIGSSAAVAAKRRAAFERLLGGQPVYEETQHAPERGQAAGRTWTRYPRASIRRVSRRSARVRSR
jgi:hypothetical protein